MRHVLLAYILFLALFDACFEAGHTDPLSGPCTEISASLDQEAPTQSTLVASSFASGPVLQDCSHCHFTYYESCSLTLQAFSFAASAERVFNDRFSLPAPYLDGLIRPPILI